MSSTRIKILLALVLIVNTTVPMEQLCHNTTTHQDFCNTVAIPLEQRLVQHTVQHNHQNLLEFENTVNVAVLTVQAAAFIWLKKKNCLFGTELIPKTVDIPWTPWAIEFKPLLAGVAFLGLFHAMALAYVNMLPPVCVYSHVNSALHMLLTSSSVTHLSNLIYDDAFIALKENFKKIDPELIIKEQLDISALDDTKCLICFEDKIDDEYVNPCNQKDHIFCKNCLTQCFNIQKEKSSFANKCSFFCELCRKKVPFNDEKFEIILPNKPGMTFRLWAEQVGPMALFYCMAFYVFTNLVRCQVS